MGRGPVAGCESAVVMVGGFGVEAASSVVRWIWVGVAMVGARGLRLDLEGFLRAELEGGTVWSHWSWDGGVEVWRRGGCGVAGSTQKVGSLSEQLEEVVIVDGCGRW